MFYSFRVLSFQKHLWTFLVWFYFFLLKKTKWRKLRSFSMLWCPTDGLCRSPADETLNSPQKANTKKYSCGNLSGCTWTSTWAILLSRIFPCKPDLVSRSREKFVLVGQTFLTQAEVYEEGDYMTMLACATSEMGDSRYSQVGSILPYSSLFLVANHSLQPPISYSPRATN